MAVFICLENRCYTLIMHITLRPATETDIPRIKQILDSAVGHKLLRGDSSWGFLEYEGEPIEASVQNGSTLVATADDGEIVGTMVLTAQDSIWGAQQPDAAYLQRLAVDFHHHRQNIGANMLDLAAQVAKQYGKSYLRLTCPSGNSKLCAYYEKQGFYRADAKANAPTQLRPTAFFENTI